MTHLDDPRQAPPLRWGFLGTGRIAATVADDVSGATVQEIRAVGSHSLDRAAAFAAAHHIERPYGSYEELVAAPDIDAIYVATNNASHFHDAKLALEAGKPVLVEKTVTETQAQAAELTALAAARGLFFMEAMWTRFLPHMVEVRRRVRAGEIGDVVAMMVDFGDYNQHDPSDRFYGLAQGGGALLDRGIYAVSHIVDVLGVPDRVVADATMADTGVDATVSAILGYASGVQAVAQASIQAVTPQESWIAGAKGLIRLPKFWSPCPVRMALASGDAGSGGTTLGQADEWFTPTVGAGYEYEFAEAATRIAAGETASPLMPPDQTVAVLGVLDQIRAQIGLRFPEE
ncbi:MAG: Gfo/Idh/MocA family oxidoreductase [Bifidobacteriaceae bacterium]|nr:Gfo/Idh/MocA family oxidoreductase [Bifidobacteriaceae bacterium]